MTVEHATPSAGSLQRRVYLRSFWFVLVALLTAFTVGTFVWLDVRTSELVNGTALEQARSYADLIIAARSWNAKHGGVYVVKTDTVLTNPYLVELGIEPDDTLSDGTPVTLRNPAAMTREIGEQLVIDRAESVFKITSLRPVNPNNAPDAWEREALEALEGGAAEYTDLQRDDSGRQVIRYARPLKVEESCLGCHGAAGYKVGDIRGAISITLPNERTSDALTASRMGLLGIGSVVLVMLWIAVFGLKRWLQGRLDKANQRLEYLATTDPLTGLWNRRHTFERLEAELERASRLERSVGVIMVDIDHFKQVNDGLGHAAGDEVLRAVADGLMHAARTYDIVGRIGGEELLIVAAEVDDDELAVIAERIRTIIEGLEPGGVAEGVSVTVSVGTALAAPSTGESADSLVARADAALYEAKDAGRNRVVRG